LVAKDTSSLRQKSLALRSLIPQAETGELQSIRSSRTWRTAVKYWEIRDRMRALIARIKR
jgi:hypothetical protein